MVLIEFEYLQENEKRLKIRDPFLAYVQNKIVQMKTK